MIGAAAGARFVWSHFSEKTQRAQRKKKCTPPISAEFCGFRSVNPSRIGMIWNEGESCEIVCETGKMRKKVRIRFGVVRRMEQHPMRYFTTSRTIGTGCVLLLCLLYYTFSSPSAGNELRYAAPPPPNREDCPLTYAIMIDAGSTGSRLHLYHFLACPAPALPTLDHESFFSTKPGLSSYPNDPAEAALSLKEMLDRALHEIPAQQHSCTKLELKATAGLRLLGEQQSKAILHGVERFIRTEYPFSLAQDSVTIMEGKDEGALVVLRGLPGTLLITPLCTGVYAWITINFVRLEIGNTRDDCGN